MATHFSILAWCTEEPKGLPSKGVQTVGHDGATKHITAAYAHMMKYCSTVGTKLEQPTHIFKHAVLCHPSFPHGHLCRREGEPQGKPWPRTVWLRQRRGRRGATSLPAPELGSFGGIADPTGHLHEEPLSNQPPGNTACTGESLGPRSSHQCSGTKLRTPGPIK